MSRKSNRKPVIQAPAVAPRRSYRGLLLVSASVMALALAHPEAKAASLYARSAPTSPTTTAINATQQGAAQAADALARAREAMSRTTQALQAMQAAQAAAHALSQSSPSNVPNGLTSGGLDPAVPKPPANVQNAASPYPASLDPSGIQTWEGAYYPTQTVSGNQVDVTVKQTQTNAILSWNSFNVGRNTTLTFDQGGNTNWVALNRVVGNSTSPSQILGTIKSDGTVLIINQNGIVFSGSSQINVGSLIASSLELGPNLNTSLYNPEPYTIAQRNENFLQNNLLGTNSSYAAFQAALPLQSNLGSIEVDKGASINTNGTDGLILMMGQHVVNDGYLSSPAGQVALIAAAEVGATKSTGTADPSNSNSDSNVRGLIFTLVPPSASDSNTLPASNFYVRNEADGLIESDEGNITLKSYANFTQQVNQNGNLVNVVYQGGSIINDGMLYATTSVSRNGSILIDGGNIQLSSNSIIAIPPDPNDASTIPQDPTSLSQFKQSEIVVGDGNSNIDMQSNAFLYAPDASVSFGTNVSTSTIPSGGPSSNLENTIQSPLLSNIFIDSGAEIDVAGMADVEVPASRNEVVISPVEGNETRDTPTYAALLHGQTVYLDPRLSGVRADGVAWIGSPLIDATSYYQLVGVSAAELMTKGGTVSFGNSNYVSGANGSAVTNTNASSVVIKSGAVIDISGGWVTYQAGVIRQTQLITADGHIVNIGDADPNGDYIGIFNGFVVDHPHWGIEDIYADTLHKDSYYEPSYTEGHDAGALYVESSVVDFEGTLYANSYPGTAQVADGKAGSGKSTLDFDQRAIQAANSELPAGGLVLISGQTDIDVTHDPSSAPASLDYGQPISIAADGTLTVAPRDPNSILPQSLLNAIQVSDALTSTAGLSELALISTGSVTVDSGANVAINPGGAFVAEASRGIVINGSVSAPSGTMNLETFAAGSGSIFTPTPVALGTSDIVVNGTLSVAGRWVNDLGATEDSLEGSAWLNGGTISMEVAANVLVYADDGTVATLRGTPGANRPVNDVSGSILINPGSTINLDSGGRIDQKGKLTLTATGGNLSLESNTFYFQASYGTADNPNVSGWSVTNIFPFNSIGIQNNPGQIATRIAIDPDSIEAHGFGGGGTFTLETPEFQLGDGTASTGTELPLSFFSSAGFSTYNITSYKTDLLPSMFTYGPASNPIHGYAGYNAVLATQTLTIDAGQTLSLIQSVLPSILSPEQSEALRDLPSGGDLLSVLSPIVPTDAWDQKPVNLSLGGLIELHVAQGGSIIGAPGATLTVSKLFNEGTIRIPGGTILQEEELPGFYGSGLNLSPTTVGIRSLSDIFTINPDGTIDPSAQSKFGGETNGGIAGGITGDGPALAIYFLGLLDADQGIVLAPGSVTDLSGTVVTNPRAVDARGNPIATGKVIAGGTLETARTATNTGSSAFPGIGEPTVDPNWILPETLVAEPGSNINLSGASGVFDEPTISVAAALRVGGYVATPVWSDAGTLVAANGGTLTGANIQANGGAPQANGGTLIFYNPVLSQNDPATPTANVVSASMIESSGFESFDALGSISSSGNVTLSLRNQFILEEAPFDVGTAALYSPTIKTGGGTLEIDAPYIGFMSTSDVLQMPSTRTGVAANAGNVTFKANSIDFMGMTYADASVANATFEASGDIRFIGVQPWQITYSQSYTPPAVIALGGGLIANGNLSFVAGQVYPVTGSTITIASEAANGTISFGRSGDVVPATPLSAGGDLGVFAANIVQDGVLRVPFGTLTLGSVTPATANTDNLYAPATQNVVLGSDSVTSVSADGLNIPYGTTTDQKEWYFSAAGNGQLSAPPAKIMNFNGSSIEIDAGATVDLSGGGDVYAYEFISGPGGSRDVLSRTNSDQYSSDNGLQYPDGRQIYAIVPSLANVPVALYDPIYSAGYNLYGGSAAGERVYLNGGPGLAAGWYTLLPAQYALLPGGMRVVEQTGASNVAAGTSIQQLDGSLLVSGYYGNANAGTSQSQEHLFSIYSQAVINSYSDISLTQGSAIAQNVAQTNGTVLPPVGVDAGRLVINPLSSLVVNAALDTTPAAGGRGSEVDIGGKNFDIVSDQTQAPSDGAIHLTAQSLDNLDAGSLLIGGTRVDNSDGTTNLDVTAQSITVSNDAAHPLIAPEILLVVDDLSTDPVASQLTLSDGATLIATGTLNDQRSGAYIINAQTTYTSTNNFHVDVTNSQDSGQGALFRVANGPQRLVERISDPQSTTNYAGGTLTVGDINASGTSIGFDTSANISIAPDANLQGQSISLGAHAMAFTTGSAAADTVVITPDLLASLSKAQNLTLNSQTSIGFDNGTYNFGSTTLDAADLVADQGGTVNIVADQLQLGNVGAAGTASDGSGTLNITANSIVMGSGTIATSGFGAGVNITAANGIFVGGTAGVLNVGNANLVLTTPFLGDRAITGSATESGYDATLTSGGSVVVTNAGTTAIDPTQIAAVPSTSLTINGDGITVSGTVIRATAGAISLQSSGALALTDGAAIEAPGFNKTYGDSADPQARSAPGGSISLAAASGGISLGNATISVGGGTGNAGTLSLSAPKGTVDFGTATIDGIGGAGGTGGIFSIDTLGAVDLVALNKQVGADGFTGGFAVTTRTGNLELGAGETLTSGAVTLTADDGSVIIGGTIDTSGINGGDIGLYGTQGVTLQSTAQLIARATGYGYDSNGNPTYDTRQAKAGNVTLGTDFLSGTTTTNADGSISGASGTITVEAGAIIDVSAVHPNDRLAPITQLGTTYYEIVPGDQGGTVSFRAPVVTDAGGHQDADVTVASASSIVGASSVTLEAFKRWDLVAVANSGLFTGVTYNASTNTVTLDATAGLDTANADGSLTTVAGLNFLGDKGPGTIVDYVQNFDVSAAYAKLGGLASQSDFHAVPGVDLAATGNIVLASNWNLGAGTVNLTGALAAGDVSIFAPFQNSSDPTSGYVVNNGAEADIFQRFTTMFYRTDGGSVEGEAPAISLRAGGNLDIDGSISDGTFLFRDQTNPQYMDSLGGTIYQNYNTVANGGVSQGTGTSKALTQWSIWPGSALTNGALVYLGLSLATGGETSIASSSGTGAKVTTLDAPYSAAGNSPAALGSFPQGTGAGTSSVNDGGDPLGSAVVFPLLANGSAEASSTYRLVAGSANLAGASSVASVQNSADPGAVDRTSSATLTVEGFSTYTFLSQYGGVSSGTPGNFYVDTNLAFPPSGTGAPTTTGTLDTLTDWINMVSGLSGVSDTGVAVLYLGTSGQNVDQTLVANLFTSFIAANNLVLNSTDPTVGYRLSSTTATLANTSYIAMSVANFRTFILNYLVPNAQALTANAGAPNSISQPTTQTSVVQSLIRTGTGSVTLAAGGTVDLRGSNNITYINIATGQIQTSPTAQFNNPEGNYFGTAQLGGPAIYTVGKLASPVAETITDPTLGVTVTTDPSTGLLMESAANSIFAKAANDAGPNGQTFALYSSDGVLLANPVLLDGGGNVTVTAGQDVLGRVGLNFTGGLPSLFSNPAGQSTLNAWDVNTLNTPYYQLLSNIGKIGIDPQLFREGLGALGGGNVTVNAGRDVSDITTASDASIIYGTATYGPSAASETATTNSALRVGGGNVTINAGRDILGGRVDVASGTATLTAGSEIGEATPLNYGTYSVEYYGAGLPNSGTGVNLPETVRDQLAIQIDDATVNLVARGSIILQDVNALGGSGGPYDQVGVPVTTTSATGLSVWQQVGIGTYSAHSGLNVVANGDITITNENITDYGTPGNGQYSTTSFLDVNTTPSYPGSLTATSIAGSIDLTQMLMTASPYGQLELFAGWNISPTAIAMLDNDPGIPETTFPVVLSNTSDTAIANQHNRTPTHTNDPTPVYLYAGNDINDVVLNVPKQARITAGQDIVNMIFYGQNLASTDVTRIVAGRDITATSLLQPPEQWVVTTNPYGGQVSGPGDAGPPEPALQGNSFLIGGPGEFYLEAGRNMGPFINSAVVTTLLEGGLSGEEETQTNTFTGGVVSVGNAWNPYLSTAQGADITVMFGVGKGADFDALRDDYVAPGSAGNAAGDYTNKLIAWMQQHQPQLLQSDYKTLDVTGDQAYAAFLQLSELQQRALLIQDVYFNELAEVGDKNSPSYEHYSRGYTAVNTLFPAALGYTANGLEGGAPNGGTSVETGDLDLRLATIETQLGGSVNILGPGGRVLAGSVVATSVQAARRTYDGLGIFTGYSDFNPVFGTTTYMPLPVAITSIPAGGEGVLTLRGGDINAFTDGDFQVNQSRVFTEQGGSILMWSSNGDLNAGQGPKTSANFPPIVVHVDDDMVVTVDQLGGVTGAGIASLESTPDSPPGDVTLLAPRGTVDAADAGVRVSGDLSVVAFRVLNSENFQVKGTSVGLPTPPAVPIGALTQGNNTAGAAAKNIDTGPKDNSDQPSVVIVEFLGFGGSQGGDDSIGAAPAGTSDSGNTPPPAATGAPDSSNTSL